MCVCNVAIDDMKTYKAVGALTPPIINLKGGRK
jgi:hypothetical protein